MTNKVKCSEPLLSSHDLGIMVNGEGRVCMAFDDPVFVHADAIFLDPDDHALHAVMFQDSFLLTHISNETLEAFKASHEVLLAGVQPDGTVLQLLAPVIQGSRH